MREGHVAVLAPRRIRLIMPRKVLNAMLGTKVKGIAGYDPGIGLTMAIERGERRGGICGLSWSTMKDRRPSWIKDGWLNVSVQMGETLRTVS